jgi:hypothetical protein
MDKKAFEEPEVGVFYLVPDPKTKKYTLHSEFGDNALHLVLWDKIVYILQLRFKKDVGEGYRGIPRGRVQLNSSGVSAKRWMVSHGNDFSFEKYKDEIISEFKLRDAEDLGLVDWEMSEHETMMSNDKKVVEKTLGIKLTKDGFNKVKVK